MFEESDRILNVISQANILDPKDIATVERALKLQESYELILNESLRLSHSNIFNLKYQKSMPKYASLCKPGFCKDCVNGIKLSSVPGGSDYKASTRYQCALKGTYTCEYNTCEQFEKY